MRVVVLGGGIAGTAAAVALRALDCEVVVYERRAVDPEDPSALGAGVVCWPNASFVLSELGLLQAALERGHRIQRMRRVSSAGRALGVLPTEGIDAAMGYPSFSILRADLHRLLLLRARAAGASVHFGRGVAELGRVDGRTEVRLEDGTTDTGALILGADGRMRSVARRHVCDTAAPVHRGFSNWIGVTTFSSPTLEAGTVLDVWGVGARFGVVPVSPLEAYWAAGLARDAGAGAVDWAGPFRDWPAPIPEILAGCAPRRVREIEVFDLDPLPRWHRDDVVLIGDAAHAAAPTSGQGVAQALEDVWHLQRLLREGHDPATVGEALFRVRAEKAASVVASGRRLAASLFERDPERARQRDASSLQTDFTAAAGAMGTFWGQGLPSRVG